MVVDRLTKAHFIPCNKTISGEGTAKLFIDQIYRYHSQPEDIVSDRAPNLSLSFRKDYLQFWV